MRVLVEVVGQALNLRGPQYGVGERLFLDTANLQHREALDRRWVRRLDTHANSEPADIAVAAVDAPHEDRMVSAAPNKQTSRRDGERGRRHRGNRGLKY